MGLSEISAGTVQDYRVHRIATTTTGRMPARSTLHNEAGTLRQALKTAIRHKWLNHLPDLSPPSKTQARLGNNRLHQQRLKLERDGNRARPTACTTPKSACG
jgi:hypothetical protein